MDVCAYVDVGRCLLLLDGLVVDLGEVLERSIQLEVDASERPSHEPFVVEVAGLGVDVAYEADTRLEMNAPVASEDPEYQYVFEWGGDAAAEIELDSGWRRASYLVAWLGRRFVSPAITVPRQGPVVVKLEPAGYLVVVPSRMPPRDMGVMRIRSADGRPFLLLGKAEEPTVRASARVEVGDLVGPLPSGRHVFEVEARAQETVRRLGLTHAGP